MQIDIPTDTIPTSHHIVLTDEKGKIIQHVKVRRARDYSEEHMLKKACEWLSREAELERLKKILKKSRLRV